MYRKHFNVNYSCKLCCERTTREDSMRRHLLGKNDYNLAKACRDHGIYICSPLFIKRFLWKSPIDDRKSYSHWPIVREEHTLSLCYTLYEEWRVAMLSVRREVDKENKKEGFQKIVRI
ncbi:hypothetical protein BDN72DRAFT_845087 [Pluteus cervinus]|uniref:Uncharacterized protein n=1 Tax=Pluteus cervinus TaxID=181527 RepID=A0ACD3AJB8_9AGAR|nr:hypothetical protein BDN72DRAFT_845087 [Pluteus cervinus]